MRSVLVALLLLTLIIGCVNKQEIGNSQQKNSNMSIASKRGEVTNTSPRQGIGPVDINSGLTAYWKFDEGKGNVTYDSSGNNNTGTLVNSPSWVQGNSAYALDFDSSDSGELGVTVNKEYVATEYRGIGEENARTFAAWVRTRCTRTCDILTYGSESSGERLEWSIEGEILGIRTYVGYILYDAPSLNDGNWHHVAIVVPEGAAVNDVLFYEDGQRLLSINKENQAAIRINTGNNTTVNIGRMYAGAKIKGNLNTPAVATDGGAYFKGSMHDLRIYGRALNDSEIQELYRSGS